MASYELTPFKRFDDVSIIAAIEQQGSLLNLGFWIKDPNHLIKWPTIQQPASKADFLWQQTCFEVFIGIRNQDEYLEINLSPAQLWQCYGFEEYRYPESIPPQKNDGAEVIELKRTHYGLNATVNIGRFLAANKASINQIFIGISAVLNTTQGEQFYALQHTSPQADFHNKRDWLHQI